MSRAVPSTLEDENGRSAMLMRVRLASDSANEFLPEAQLNDGSNASPSAVSANPNEAVRNVKSSKSGKRPQRRTYRAENLEGQRASPTRTDAESSSSPDPQLAGQSKIG